MVERQGCAGTFRRVDRVRDWQMEQQIYILLQLADSVRQKGCQTINFLNCINRRNWFFKSHVSAHCKV